MTAMENLAEAPLFAEQEDDVFLIVTLAGQACGLPVMLVRHLRGPQVITPIPLAPSEVVGGFNLGGRIVTAIDLRRRLSLPIADDASIINVIVEYAGGLYSLIVDQVQEVAQEVVQEAEQEAEQVLDQLKDQQQNLKILHKW